MGQYDRGHGMCVCGPVGQRSPPVLAGESKNELYATKIERFRIDERI